MGFACPKGHWSSDEDYCDTCGARNPGLAPEAEESKTHPAGAFAEQSCAVCQAVREGDDRYCGSCGYDFETGEPWSPASPAEPIQLPRLAAPPAQEVPRPAPEAPHLATSFVLVVSVDTSRFTTLSSPAPPADLSQRVFMLDRPSLVIGRDGPNLDIPIHGDPYVSRRHAEIIWLEDGWAIRDLGSTNGTRVNGETLEGTEVKPLAPDDVVELGFFSRLTVRRL